MAQGLTVKVENNPFMDGTEPFKIILDWKANASTGAVSIPIASTYTTQNALLSAAPVSPNKIRGGLLATEFIPGLNGDLATTRPTNAYDVTILDKYGLDILGGNGADRSGTVADKCEPASTTIAVDSELTLTIANAGNDNTGRIIMNFMAFEGTN
jgi:hypothetical protein